LNLLEKIISILKTVIKKIDKLIKDSLQDRIGKPDKLKENYNVPHK